MIAAQETQSRERLIELIKSLPDSQIPVVKTFIEFVIHKDLLLEDLLASAGETEQELSDDVKAELEKRAEEESFTLDEITKNAL